MDGNIGLTAAVVGAIQEEQGHQDEDDHKDYHPVTLLYLQNTHKKVGECH